MTRLILLRLPEEYDCTPGDFYLDGVHLCNSLELPWVNNVHDISCIPKGVYSMMMTYSERFHKPTLQLLNVVNRTGIRIHSANLASQLKGCIAPCVKFVIDKDMLFGENSRIAVDYLENTVAKEHLTYLEIM